MMNLIFVFMALVLSALAERSALTSRYDSPHGQLVDLSTMEPGVCYIGVQNPEAHRGWFEAVLTNDEPAPVSMWIDGYAVKVYRYTMGEMTTNRVMVHRGSIREQYVLYPGERCHMVMPMTTLDSRGWARYRVVVERLVRMNMETRRLDRGTEGTIHLSRFQVGRRVQDNWTLTESHFKRGFMWTISRSF